MVEKIFLSEYFGERDGRSAEITKSIEGYSVTLKMHGKVVGIVNLHEHSVDYAEDTAENWVEGILK